MRWSGRNNPHKDIIRHESPYPPGLQGELFRELADSLKAAIAVFRSHALYLKQHDHKASSYRYQRF
jgi:hypothetical protein